MKCKVCGQVEVTDTEAEKRGRRACVACESKRMREYYAKRTNRLARVKATMEELEKWSGT
jgi:hypothetical protein